MTFIIPKGGREEASFQGSELDWPIDHQNDAKTASIFLLGPTSQVDPTNFYSPLQYVPGLDGTGNQGFDYALWGFPPSCLAI